jgi:hypothetical protein
LSLRPNSFRETTRPGITTPTIPIILPIGPIKQIPPATTQPTAHTTGIIPLITLITLSMIKEFGLGITILDIGITQIAPLTGPIPITATEQMAQLSQDTPTISKTPQITTKGISTTIIHPTQPIQRTTL